MLKVRYSQKNKFKNPDFSRKEIPSFAEYAPNLKEIKKVGKKLLRYENIIIAARGGSITSFKAYFECLAKYKTKKSVYFIDTVDPVFLDYVKRNCPIKKTIVIVISKSGCNVEVNENYFYFKKYKCLFITTPNNNPLHTIALKRNIQFLPHPEIGGRFVGFTAIAFLPSFLVGINIDKLWEGAKKAYADFSPKRRNNLALNLATYLFNFDKKGYVDIYMPIYSNQLSGFSELILQLIHESVCKDRKGPTIIPVTAPESQHHTSQRYFGGRKNMQGLFLKLEKFSNNEKLSIDKNLYNISIRGGKLALLDKLSVARTMDAEFTGTFTDSIKRNVPASAIIVNKVNEEPIGYFMGFLHYLTVYLCWLNKVNPYNQPEVETSKEISFKQRLKK